MPTIPSTLAPTDAYSTPPGEPTKIADAIQQTKDRQRQDFVSTLETVGSINPDEYAKATQVSKLSGIPADVLHQHREKMDKLLKGNKYAGTYDSFPKTAKGLAQGQTAVLAQDDIDNLTRIEMANQQTRFDNQSTGEKLFGAVDQAVKQGQQGARLSYTDKLQRLSDSFDNIDQEITRAALVGENPYPNGDNPTGFGFDYLSQTPEGRVEMRNRLIGRQEETVKDLVDTQGKLDAMPVEPGALRYQQLGGDFSAMAQAIGENPGYAARAAVGSAASSAEILVAGALGGPLAAGVVEFGIEGNAKLFEVLREAKIDMNNPKAVLAALQDDDLMNDARKRAARKAAGTTAVDVLGMGLAGHLLVPKSIGGKALSNTQRELVNLGVQFPVQGITGAASEAAGQYAADQKISGGDVLMEAVAGAGMSSLEVATFGGGRIMDNIKEGLAKSRQAKQGRAALDEMTDAALNSKLRGRDADAFNALVTEQLKDSAMETISIPAESLAKLNQDGSAPVLDDLLARVPGLTEQFAEAQARGGSVQIKTADYLTAFAEHHEALSGSIRTQIDGMSTEETVLWNKAQEEQIQALADSIRNPPSARDDAFIGLMAELQQAGYRRQDAEQYAAVHLSALSTLATRSGVDLETLMARFPLDIRNKAPESVTRIPVDDMRIAINRLRTGDIPQSRDMFGKSLVEYLRDAGGLDDTGGELAALDVNIGKVGRNRLVRPEGGLSLDDAAMRAWENGYFPGVPREEVGPQMIVDAVRRDMNDEPTFSVENENATLRDQATNLQQLQDYLDQLGVNVNELTDDQVLAILRDPESIQGVKLDDIEATPLPEREDGTSGRVSSDGLVIVHGSNSDAMTPESIQIVRTNGQKQGKKGRVYGGFYGTSEMDAAQAEGYAGMGEGTPTIYDVRIKPGTGVLNKTGDVTRLSESYINELVGQGYGLVVGTDPRGRTEYVVIDKNAIESMGKRGEQTQLNQAALPKGWSVESENTPGSDNHVVSLKDENGKVQYRATVFSDTETPGWLGFQYVANETRERKGLGSAFYRSLADYAKANGMRLLAGVESTPSAQKVQDELIASGGARIVSAEEVFGPDAAPGVTEAMTANPYEDGRARQLVEILPNETRLEQQGVTREQVRDQLIEKYPGLKLDLMGNGNVVTLSRIVIPEDGRQSGRGTEVMQALIQWADASGKKLALTPSADFGGNKKRLVDFYKRFGFVENKGRNKDYEVSESMVREPQLNQTGSESSPRGYITFNDAKPGTQRKFQITVTARRDLSTLLHEFGHYYLEVVNELASDGTASQQMIDDVAAIRQWTGAAPTGPFAVEQHEQFARGFEAYLAEGKAPNPEIQGAFSRFKRWIIAIYKDLVRLNVELTPEIRGVMDRIVATDEQITAAEQVAQAIPMFDTAAKAGMTEEEFLQYRNQVELAHAEAAETMEQQIIREEERRNSKWWGEETARVANEVSEELDTMPEYQAIRALRTGAMPDGTTQKIKLQGSEIKEIYGTAVLRKLAFMHGKDGVPMDIAAQILGFESGDQMIKSILGAPPRAEAIKAETAARMLERHGAKADGASTEKAMAAVHNEKHGAVLLRELNALGKQGNRKNITSQQVLKMAAARIMQERKVRDIQPFEYQRAEGMAGRRAFEAAAKGDLAAAYEAKQQQLLNFHLWREAKKARDQIDKIVDRMAGFNKSSRREKLGKAGHSYLDQIDAVMEQYEFRTVSLRDLDKRVSFAKWYADQLALGNEPDVPEFIINTTAKVNYKDLSLSQLEELDDFAQNVNHLAGLKNKLLANKRLKDFEVAKNELVRAARENLAKKKPRPIDKGTMSALENMSDWAGNMSSALLKMEQIIQWLDDGDIEGPWHTTFWQPFVEAQVAKDDLNREFTAELMGNVDRYIAARGQRAMREQIHIPAIGQSLTRNAIISAALNTGNAGNRSKLLNGYGWSEQQLAAILANMNKDDWTFAQAQWDLVEKLWPQIEQLEKDLHGVAPDKIVATPVTTEFGVYSGGYWPLVYDTSSPEYAQVANNLTDNTGLFEQGYARATTPKGHTKARVDSFAAPIMLDTSIVASHLGQVIHDLTHRKAIIDAAKIISNKEIKQALNETLGENIANQFNPWLQGVANDMVMDSQKGIDAWTNLSSTLRANLSVAWMGFSATTGMQQILGFSQTWEHLAQLGARKHLPQAMLEYVRAPFKTMAFVKSLSGEMRNRDANLDNNMREVLKRISGKAGPKAVIQRLAFKHIAVIQSMVDYPTWLSAYHKGMADGETLDTSVAMGDRAVRLSQMSGGPKDLAAVQRKDGLMKALTIVYSYFNLLYNRQADLVHTMKTAEGVKDYLQAFERTIFLIALPALLAPLMTGHGPEDDESWGKWAALKIATYPMMSVPLLRDVGSSLESGWAYSGATPIGDVFKSTTKLAAAVTQDDLDAEKITMSTMDVVGMGFGLPTAQPKRTAKYLFSLERGENQDDNMAQFIRGLMFGPPKEPK
ncbi:MAG: hypothetical protein V4749_17995 [Pseudomonadota bacterium]